VGDPVPTMVTHGRIDLHTDVKSTGQEDSMGQDDQDPGSFPDPGERRSGSQLPDGQPSFGQQPYPRSDGRAQQGWVPYGQSGNQQAYGQQPYGQQPYGQQPYHGQPNGQQPNGQAVPGPVPRNMVVAVLLALFLGTFGVHNFYLGYTQKGVIQLVLNVVGWATTWLLVGFVLVFAVAVWVIVDIIQIATRQGQYVADANGVPLQ